MSAWVSSRVYLFWSTSLIILKNFMRKILVEWALQAILDKKQHQTLCRRTRWNFFHLTTLWLSLSRSRYVFSASFLIRFNLLTVCLLTFNIDSWCLALLFFFSFIFRCFKKAAKKTTERTHIFNWLAISLEKYDKIKNIKRDTELRTLTRLLNNEWTFSDEFFRFLCQKVEI